MRLTVSEKHEIIHLAQSSDLIVKMTLDRLNITKSTFYDWYNRYLEEGFEELSLCRIT